MSETFAGHYPLEHRAGEIERLRIQGEGMAPDTRTMLERIGVGPGWHCLDIVHMRFIASTAGEPERLIREAMRLTRPGGVVALQEPDGSTLNCYPPHPAWDRLKAALLGAFAGVGADLTLARKLYALVRDSGLADVQYRPFLVGVRSIDPMVDYLPSTVESLRGTIVRLGLLSDA